MSDAQQPLWSDEHIERTAEALVMTAIQALPQGDTKQITKHIADALTTVRDDLLAESQPVNVRERISLILAGYYDNIDGDIRKMLEDDLVQEFAESQPAAQQTDVLICDKCNDHLEAPSYCETCYSTLESAYQEAENEVKALKQRQAAVRLGDIVAQLRSCNYQCEAGSLTDNVAWQELERMAARDVPQPDWAQGLIVNEYQIAGGEPFDVESHTLVRQPQDEGADKWAIYNGRHVLNREGKWEWEPMPSNRDEDFMRRCRFDTPQEALACYRKSQEPTT
jgi:hypothetical protein